MVGRVGEPGPDARMLGRALEELAENGTLAAWIEDDSEVYRLAEQLLRAVQALEREPVGGDGVVGPPGV